MAPPPEYDKEPKAPDKSASSISTEDSKLLHNLVNDQHTNSDHKSTNTVTAIEVENKKHIETLDDGQLKALLDEAINYKNPKDREGKSDIFKELLEKAEQETDEQACEAAARTLSGCRSTRRGGRRGPPLPHSNSLQDLVAALAAEPPRKHHVRHHPPPHAPQTNVSARAIHGGSLPSGVDTSSLSEEPARGAGYLATVRCVNPPPLAERRVSASDANTPAEMELLNRRSKPMFPMTYTARATLEIGSGAVCSGRAVTTTTASNQVRTTTCSATTPATTTACQVPDSDPQMKLMNALCPLSDTEQGGCGQTSQLQLSIKESDTESASTSDLKGKTNIPRGPKEPDSATKKKERLREHSKSDIKPVKEKHYLQKPPKSWVENVDNWYKSLSVNYPECLKSKYNDINKINKQNIMNEVTVGHSSNYTQKNICEPIIQEISYQDKNIKQEKYMFDIKKSASYSSKLLKIKESNNVCHVRHQNSEELSFDKCQTDFEKEIIKEKVKITKKRHNLVAPSLSDINPKNIRPMSIGSPKKQLKTEPISSQKKLGLTNNPVDINSNSVNIVSKYKKECVENTNNETSNVESKCPQECCTSTKKREQLKELTDMFNKLSGYASADIELKDLRSSQRHTDKNNSFSKYVTLQQKLLLEIESLQDEITNHKHDHEITTDSDKKENKTNLQENIPSNDKQKESSDLVPLTSMVKETCEGVVQMCHVEENPVNRNSDVSKELSNNAYVLLTLPSSNNTEHNSSESTSKSKNGKKKDNLSLAPSRTNKKEEILNKNILKVLLFENLFKNISNENSVTSEVSAITNEVDSAISFSCITTPEVVASCNTTSSTSQAAVAVDPKPRSVISSSFNGLPLSRPNYGSTGSAATDDYKKSIDENGNSVQGFSSPLSGSSQHKKPRRKKSTKNETLIDCQQIDGYQGDKDVNELLRFIESNADSGRGAKLSRVKHKDDSDDKTGKKRSSERRKDKESKIKRASSLEELSRTKIEDLTDAAEGSLRADKKERRDHAPAKQERRSWGDDAREPLEPPPSELTDFQTVTKKRKPRRRADEPERDPPRRARPPSPRARRESAPPSDRSNDSNDDLDSVHSLPDAPRPPTAPALPAPHASYAEIARTRHNIPDLIESCNFYAEGEGAPRPETAPPGDADGYPALDARAAAARRRDLKTAPVSSRRDRKERVAPPTEGPQAPDCPAPDVVADRRPPVILLDSAVRPRDMDGVTFGFDINEQLLSGPARRPRCDLLRDALRYVPPDAPDAPGPPGPPHQHQHQHHSHQLCQIVDYVGAAWEDVLRCGSGKVRYFNE